MSFGDVEGVNMKRSESTLPKRRRIAVVQGVIVLVSMLVLPIARADAADVVRWVSPGGNGSACSSSKPCSLTTAQSQVRSATSKMTGDLIVRLLGGVYSLTSPLSFGASDSGTGDHVVRYEAAPGAEPVISGGKRITGWSVKDRAKNIWQASIPSSFTARQLYVNGRRATLASRPVGEVLGSLTQTSTGYTVTKTDIRTWSRPTDTELVYPGGGNDPNPDAVQSVAAWTWSMCGVSSVSGSNVVVDPACYANARSAFEDADGNSMWPYITKPVTVQNNYALLGTPGQFYLDDSANRVYYVPRAGENLATSTITMPQVSSLLTATSVHDLQLSGLTFEYSTWAPSPTLGIVNIQANVLATRTNFLSGEAADLGSIPAAVSFNRADRVIFERNVVRHVGGTAVAFIGGGSDYIVRGNVISDASAGGINLSDGKGLYAPSSYESDVLVSNNLVSNVSVEFQGGAAIYAGWVKHTTVSHNEISDVPWIGISLGWGWESYASTMVDNHVDGNIVRNVMSSSLNDGGGIYVLGREGASVPSTISGNYVSGVPQPYGAIYLDSGASNFRVTGNVVEKAPNGWLFLQNLDGGLAYSNVISGNYADTDEVSSAVKGPHPSNSVVDNWLALSSWPAAAQAIIDSAGLERAYQDIR